MKAKIGIIGYGNIGKEVKKRVLQRGWVVPVIARTSGIYDAEEKKIDKLDNWLEHFKKVDIAVLSISTLDDGTIAYNYIKNLVENEIPVATSEKGAWGNYGPELKRWEDKIGYFSVIGGGTRMSYWLKERLSPGTKKVLLVINGTLNFTFEELSKGKPIEEVVGQAKELGYTEPGARTPLEVINTEAGKDVPMKISALINLCGFGKIRAREIKVKNIDEKDLKRLKEEATFRWYIVSITRKENEEDVIGGFNFKMNHWYISGGFKNLTQNLLFLQLVPPGVNNAALIYGSEGTYILTGNGAGATPTVLGGIMPDIENLLKS